MGIPRTEGITTEVVMMAFGIAHLVFGVIFIFFQCLCEYISWTFMNHTMFEDTFKPGFGLGAFIIVLGIGCLVQFRRPRHWSHICIILYSMFIVVLVIFYMVFWVIFFLDDPESNTFEDCSSPYVSKFFLDDPPHCLAKKFNTIFGQCMMAFASAQIIVIVMNFIMICGTHYAYTTAPY